MENDDSHYYLIDFQSGIQLLYYNYKPWIRFVKASVYVVDIKYYNTKLNYLKEHYYPDARKELVADINGFYIWKYYAQ